MPNNLDLFPEDAAKSSEQKAQQRKASTTSSRKSRSAYRTISEASEDVGVATHVLRFWETKFKDIKPTKRSGGRRYYSADDVVTLKKIRRLLYDEGYTIKGVQAYLKRGGASDVVASSSSSGVAPSFFKETLSELQDIRDLLRGAQ